MAKTNAIILGAGMVGSVMAADLAPDDEVTVSIADRSQVALDRAVRNIKNARIETVQTDLSDPDAIKATIEPFDLVLGALSSEIGYRALRAVIESGKPYCDISFMPENALKLDALAKQHCVKAIVDCGIAPGMSNLLAGYGVSQMDHCERIEIYVGGVPRSPRPPYFYKAAFSPADVIEEYTRPARLVEDGEIVTREALSEPELVQFPEVGALEAFNTDGLRSIMFTMNATHMKEKTLRWPGHRDLMWTMRETGFFSRKPIEVSASPAPAAEPEAAQWSRQFVRPLDLTSALLFPAWSYEEGEEDLTVMRIIVAGERGGQEMTLTWDLLDSSDKTTGRSSMARTTAYPCTIIARMLASGELSAKPGVIVPEMLGQQPGVAERILEALKQRGVNFQSSIA